MQSQDLEEIKAALWEQAYHPCTWVSWGMAQVMAARYRPKNTRACHRGQNARHWVTRRPRHFELAPGIVAVKEMSAFGGSMKHIERVDFHRKDIAMAQKSEGSSQARGRDIAVDTRNRWLFGALTLASFFTLQTFLPVGPKDLALTVSLLAFAVVLPMNILLVLLTYAKKGPNDKVRLFCLSSPAVAGTFIGINAAFWHASWYLGVVFTVASVIGFAVALYYWRLD